MTSEVKTHFTLLSSEMDLDLSLKCSKQGVLFDTRFEFFSIKYPEKKSLDLERIFHLCIWLGLGMSKESTINRNTML